MAIDICNGNDVEESARICKEILCKYGLADELTEDEKPYLDLAQCGSISIENANEMQWRIEMCMPLFWACGYWKKLDYPNEMTDASPLFKTLFSCDSFDDIMKKVKMRELSEILDGADLIFRMDWACVEARIKNDPQLMGDLFPDVVVEQHKGFNWLIGAFDAENWDTVAPHT